MNHVREALAANGLDCQVDIVQSKRDHGEFLLNATTPA
jgi:hypothetical protein